MPTAPPSTPPTKKARFIAPAPVPQDLGKLVARDTKLLAKLGWKSFVASRRKRNDFNVLKDIKHPAARLLHHLDTNGVPVILKSTPWSVDKIQEALKRGPHRSSLEYIDFLEEEFVDMINKNQWIVLPFDSVKHLNNLRLSPPGVVPQRNRRPRWICDYSWSGVNADTTDTAPNDAMQFGHALDRILREILLADPEQGKIYIIKVDISDGFYRIHVRPDDVPKLGVIFPTKANQEEMIAFPLVLPMGWKHSPPYFCAATETAADLANTALQTKQTCPAHPLDDLAHTITAEPSSPTLHSPELPTASLALPVPSNRDPCLPSKSDHLQYVDVFMDDFIALCQGTKDQRHVRSTLLYAIDEIFRPNDAHDNSYRREPVSIKKLKQGDCSWSTIREVLGWIINTATMTIQLPLHRQERLAEILASIPPSQKRISVKKWHKVLGELRSMATALPGARHIFSHMQLALTHRKKGRLALRKGVHQALNDFRWLASDISQRPTRIQELIPLQPSLMGDHDASGDGAGGVWFPSATTISRVSQIPKPILWRFQ